MDSKLLTPYQRRRLQHQLHHTQNAHQYRRILAILQCDKGKSIPEISQALEVSRRSIYRWLNAYSKAHHVGILEDAYRSGRPRLCDDEMDSLVRMLLTSSPEQFGLVATNWTVPLLREYLERSSGQHLSAATVRREIQHLGFVWKRPRYVLAPDPDREKKKKNYSPNQRIAASQCHIVRRRNRSSAVSSSSCYMVPARTIGRSSSSGV
ncbi:MAG: helix-turn-helix domain-containing protein [Nitrospirota bacterium]